MQEGLILAPKDFISSLETFEFLHKETDFHSLIFPIFGGPHGCYAVRFAWPL